MKLFIIYILHVMSLTTLIYFVLFQRATLMKGKIRSIQWQSICISAFNDLTSIILESFSDGQMWRFNNRQLGCVFLELRRLPDFTCIGSVISNVFRIKNNKSKNIFYSSEFILFQEGTIFMSFLNIEYEQTLVNSYAESK